LRVLALSFLIISGFGLLAESLHEEISKAYLNLRWPLSLAVETININVRKKNQKSVNQ